MKNTTETALGDSLKNYSEPKYDSVCKTILSDKQILARIMCACVPEYSNCSIEEAMECIENKPLLNVEMDEINAISGKNGEDISIPGAVIKYDVLFTATTPKDNSSIEMFINIEAQADDKPGYPLIDRAIYYCSRLIARQKNATDGFTGSNYGDIKKVYSIWICTKPSKDKAGTINMYSIKEDNLFGYWHEKPENYDLLRVIMIFPPKDCNLQANRTRKTERLMDMLSALFDSKIKYEVKKCYLEEKHGIMMVKELKKGVEDMCNLSKNVKNEGKLELAIEYISTLMTEHGMSLEKAMDFLKVADELRSEIRELLTQEQ